MKIKVNTIVVSLFAVANILVAQTGNHNSNSVEHSTNKEIADSLELTKDVNDNKSLDELFKIKLESDKIVIQALVPLKTIKDVVYLNILSSESEVIIHQLVEDGITKVDLKNFKNGEYFIEVGCNDKKIVKHIAWK